MKQQKNSRILKNINANMFVGHIQTLNMVVIKRYQNNS